MNKTSYKLLNYKKVFDRLELDMESRKKDVLYALARIDKSPDIRSYLCGRLFQIDDCISLFGIYQRRINSALESLQKLAEKKTIKA